MATYTPVANTNLNALSGKGGGDTYNLNGITLTIDSDTRFGVNQTTSTSLGNINLSASLGGSLEIDARAVRYIPYSGGSGNVPAAGTTISQGSASGSLISVSSGVGSAPTAAGSPMPASGVIKVNAWNGTNYAAGALTGITANATGQDVVGVITLVGDEATGITASRLNTVRIRGDYYDLGATTGSNSDAFQIPTNGANIYGAGVMVDATAEVNISSASWSSGFTVVNTGSAHNLSDYDRVLIDGVSPAAYNGTYMVMVVDADSFMFVQDADPGSYVSGGKARGIEFYPCANGIAATSAAMATDFRGKVCWISTAGVVRFQNDGTNSTGGYLPPSGRRVRIPNVILQTCTTAARTQNAAPNATLTTRYDFNVAGGAPVDFNYCWSAWYFSMTSAYSISIKNSIVVNRLLVGNIVAPIVLENAHFAHYDSADSAQTGMISMTNCQQGGTYENVCLVRSNHVANGYLLNAADSLDHLFYGCKFYALVTRTGTTNGAIIMQRCNDFIFRRSGIGVGLVSLTTALRNKFIGTTLWSEPVAGTLSANGYFAFAVASSANDNEFDGVDFGGLSRAMPYSGILSIGSGSSGNILKNIGSYNSPLDLGGAPVTGATWSRSGTTVTVTSTAHGLLTGDVIFPYIVSNRVTITSSGKTITVTDANTFTFTGANSGDTSGTLCYYLVVSGYVFQISNSTAADGFLIQAVYAAHTRSGLYTTDATSKNIVIKDVYSDFMNGMSLNAQGMTFLNSSGLPSPNAVSSIYGTHFYTAQIADVQTTTSATWTRSGTSVTLTCTNHGWRDGRGTVWIDVSSDTAALDLGEKSIVANTGLPNPDTIVVTGVNAGATSGTATIRVPNARLGLAMNEANTDTLESYDILSGSPKFTSTGGLYMPTIGDEIAFYSPEIKGISSVLPNLPTMGAATLNNFDIFYSIDILDGNGWGTEKNLSYARTGGAVVSGNNYCTVTDATGVRVGDYAFGTGIPLGAKVTSVDTMTNQIGIDRTTTTTTSLRTYTFSSLPNEALDASGFKIKIRIKTNTTNATAITSLYMPCQSSATDRQNQYPQDVETVSFTLSGLPSGTTVALYDADDQELLREDNITDGSFVYEYEHTGTDIEGVYYVIWHVDYVPFKSDPFDLTTTDLGLSYTPIDDPIYNAAHDDRYTFDFADKLIIMETGETVYDVPGAYSHWKDQIFLSDNFTYDFAFTIQGGTFYDSPKGIPAIIGLINGWRVRPDEADHLLTMENGIIYVVGGGRVTVPVLGDYTVEVQIVAPVDVLMVSTEGGGGATPAEVWEYANRSLTTTDKTGLALETSVQSAITKIDTVDTVVDGIAASVPSLATTSQLSTVNSNVLTAIDAVPTAGENATAVRSEISTELGRVDATISSRLASTGYTAPANSDIAAIKAVTDALDVPTTSEIWSNPSRTLTATDKDGLALESTSQAISTAVDALPTLEEIMSRDVEGGTTFEQILRVALAMASGQTVIDESGEFVVVKFKSQDGTKDRISATMDGSERTDTVIDGS